MPWILAGAALLGTALSSQQQGQSSAGGQRQQAIAGRQQQQPGGFTPTAQSSQQAIAPQAPSPGGMSSTAQQLEGPYGALAGEMSRRNSGQAVQPPPVSGVSNTLGNVNSAVQTGATLQQIFQGAQNQGANTRAQALAGRQAGPAQPYQPTAMNQMDPRLQQLLGR